MIDPAPLNLVRPYACVDCGQPMRDRGVDGRCGCCMAAPTVVCQGYRDEWGDMRSCGRVIQRGGGPVVEGTCVLCALMRERAQGARYAREGRELLRERARGYMADPDDVDWKAMTKGE